MRIILGLGSLAVGGTELHTVRTAAALTERGHDVRVVSFAPEGPIHSMLVANGIDVISALPGRLGSRGNLRCAREIRSLVRSFRPDVFHSQDVYSNIFGLPIARTAGVPAVFGSRRWWKATPRPIHGRLNRVAYSFAHGVVTNSARTAEMMTRDERVPAARIHVVNNFIADGAFDRPSEAGSLRSRLGVPAPDLLVGMVARLAPVKNHALALDAIARLHAAGLPVHLALVGDGPLTAELRGRAATLGIADRVHFLGFVDRPQPLNWEFDVAVLCSVSEGFPNTVVEAMAAARAVVATDVGGVREAVCDAETGFVVPSGDTDAFADALATLAADPGLRTRMGALGSDRARTLFSQDAYVSRVEQIYGSVSRNR